MKTRLILLLLIFGISLNVFSQTNPFETSEISWYGIDFFNARFIGSRGFSNPKDIKQRYFDSWNRLILKESAKYNIEKFFKKRVVDYDTIMVQKRNAMVDADALVIDHHYHFEKDQIPIITKSYDTGDKTGVGLVFIVESFNKLEDRSYIYVTFFDIATKEVLFTEKLRGEGGGFSVRNFWAHAILMTMEASHSKLKKWAKQ
jgi:hypothetical protein